MLKKLTICASAVVLVGATAGAALADATISGLKGNVLVNSGVGYVASKDGAVLKNGSRIMVTPQSSAVLTFSDGCKVPLSAGVVTIGEKSPCSFRAQQGDGNNNDNTALIAAGAGAVLLGVGIWAITRDDKFKSP